MSGVKAVLQGTAQNTGLTGNPAANAGQSEPSIDDILASIRQIISDQNKQADDAAQKAAIDVANKQPAPANVQSIIGTVSAEHLSNSPPSAYSMNARPAGQAVNQSIATAPRHSNPNELEELIQLIGSSPPAPVPTRQAKWVDPQSRDSAKLRRDFISAETRNTPAAAGVVVNQPVLKPVVAASPVVLRENDAVNTLQPKEVIQARLHPSVSPKTTVPQAIKDAITPRFAAKNVAPAAGAERPIVSHKSALDLLIAKKEGMSGKAVPAPKAPAPPVQSAQTAQPTQAKVAPPVRQAVAGTPAPAAISAKAVNAAVVKSIERLATSMFEDRKDEIDGMMAGIVRPMLQDWLEDNLPSLVERIVREEIERVSRGTHR